MERLFRRAEVPLGMSQGFHPKPRMSFPAALAVGIEGLDEVMEVELAAELDADELSRRLAAHTVPGLAFHRVEILPPGIRSTKARLSRLTYQIDVPPDLQEETARAAAALRAGPSRPIWRGDRPEPIDLLEFLEDLNLSNRALSMTFRATQQAAPGPRDVLAALGLCDLERQGARLRRTRVELQA